MMKALESEALRVLIGAHDADLIAALHANMAAQREAADRLQKLILEEMHHRIKNNLQTVAMLLRMLVAAQRRAAALRG